MTGNFHSLLTVMLSHVKTSPLGVFGKRDWKMTWEVLWFGHLEALSNEQWSAALLSHFGELHCRVNRTMMYDIPEFDKLTFLVTSSHSQV